MLGRTFHLVHEWRPDQVWGIGRFVSRLVPALRDNGQRSDVASLSMASFRNFVGGHDGMLAVRCEPTRRESLLSEWEEQNRQLELLLRGSVCRDTIVHCHDWLAWPAAQALRERTRCKIALSIYTHLPFRRERHYLEVGGDLESRAVETQIRACAEADAVIVPDRRTAFYVRRDGCRRPLFIVPMATTVEWPAARSRTPRLLFLGRLAPEKGVDVLAGVARRLSRDVEFIVVGAGPMSRSLHELIGSRRIDFRGYSDEPRRILNSASLVVVPSRYDTGPLVALEALFAGIPVVMSAACGVSSFVRKVCPEMVARLTVNSFANRIREALAQNDAWRVAALKCRRRLIGSAHDISHTAKRLRSIYAWMVRL
ncbi:MAG: glycosyltransferase family 4 protein [Thermoanaerobaculia bacterium]